MCCLLYAELKRLKDSSRIGVNGCLMIGMDPAGQRAYFCTVSLCVAVSGAVKEVRGSWNEQKTVP